MISTIYKKSRVCSLHTRGFTPRTGGFTPRIGGFTLIELLVVVAILGGLSALLLPNFMDARVRARDSQRKNDIKQLQKSLELYKLDSAEGAYPTPAGASAPDLYFPPTVDTKWTGVSGNVYINKVPKDPSSGTAYFYYRPTPLSYTLCSCLENAGDLDGSKTGSCPGLGSVACTSTNVYYVNEP